MNMKAERNTNGAVINTIEANTTALTGAELDRVTGGAANDLKSDVNYNYEHLKEAVSYLAEGTPNKSTIENYVLLCQYYINANAWSDVKSACKTICNLTDAFAETGEAFTIRYFANEIVKLLNNY